MMSELPRRHGRRCGGGGKSKKLRAEQILSSSVCNGQPHHVQELGSVSKSSRQPNSTILPPCPLFSPVPVCGRDGSALCKMAMEPVTCWMSCQLSDGGFGLSREDSRERDKTSGALFLYAGKRSKRPLRRGEKGPGRLIWKEIGSRCWDPGKWSWDEAGRTKKRERGARTRPNSFFWHLFRSGLAVSLLQTFIPSSKPGTHDVNTRPRSSSICHIHTPTQPSPSLPSLASNDRSKQSTTSSDLSVDPSSFFFLPIFGTTLAPFSASSKITPAPPLHPPRRILQSVPIASARQATPSVSVPGLDAAPRLRSPPPDSILPFDPAHSAWSLRLQQQQLSVVVSSLDHPPTARRIRPPPPNRP